LVGAAVLSIWLPELLAAGQQTLNVVWELGSHHLPSVELAPVDNESSVANSVNHALLIACGIDPCGNPLEHDDVVLLDDVDDLAL
jgi:hypothetical protein